MTSLGNSITSAPPIAYIARTRAYYLALGYDNPYQWAQFDDIPFTRLKRPLNKAKVAIVTTAAPFQPEHGDQGPGAPYNADAKFYDVYKVPASPIPDLRISHVAIDRAHTTAEDPASYLPQAALMRAKDDQLIGEAAAFIYGLPTNRSQRTTSDVDAPNLLELLIADQIDAAIFIPNCPICHQSASLAARHIEQAGIATVVMGCAFDIMKQAGVPRSVFSDFPLGNSAGRPHDIDSQDKTLRLALDMLQTSDKAGAMATSPLRWADDDCWKEDYSNPDKLSAEELARRKAEFDQGKAIASKIRATAQPKGTTA